MPPIAFLLVQTTLLAVVGYFVLFAAGRAQGLLRHMGNVLGFWTLAIALVALLAGATAPLAGRNYGTGMMGGRWTAPEINPFRLPPRTPNP